MEDNRNYLEKLISIDSNIDAEILVDYIKQQGIKSIEDLNSCDSTLKSEIIEWLVSIVKQQEVAEINKYNTQVSEALKWFANNGIWVNLSQIRRALLHDMEVAIANAIKSKGETQILKGMLDVVRVDKQWNNISQTDKQRMINQYNNDMEKL